MARYEYIPVWRQPSPTPSRRDGEWHWHAPANAVPLVAPVENQLEQFRGRRSAHWIVTNDGFGWLESFSERVGNRTIPGFSGFMIRGVDASQDEFSRDLPGLLLAAPIRPARIAEADEPAVPNEISPSTESRSKTLPDWLPVDRGDAASLQELAEHMLSGNGLEVPGNAPFSDIVQLLGQLFEWLPPKARTRPRAGFLAPGIRDAQPRELPGAQRLDSRYLAKAWQIQLAAGSMEFRKSEGWPILHLLATPESSDMKRCFAKLLEVGAGWKSPTTLRNLLTSWGVAEIGPLSRTVGSDHHTANQYWFSLLYDWSEACRRDSGYLEFSGPLSELLLYRFLADQFRRLDSSPGSTGSTAPPWIEPRLRQVWMESMVRGHARRELVRSFQGHFVPFGPDDSIQCPAIERFMKEVAAMNGQHDDPVDARIEQLIAGLSGVVDMTHRLVAAQSQELDQGRMALDEFSQAAEQKRMELQTSLVERLQTALTSTVEGTYKEMWTNLQEIKRQTDTQIASTEAFARTTVDALSRAVSDADRDIRKIGISNVVGSMKTLDANIGLLHQNLTRFDGSIRQMHELVDRNRQQQEWLANTMRWLQPRLKNRESGRGVSLDEPEEPHSNGSTGDAKPGGNLPDRDYSGATRENHRRGRQERQHFVCLKNLTDRGLALLAAGALAVLLAGGVGGFFVGRATDHRARGPGVVTGNPANPGSSDSKPVSPTASPTSNKSGQEGAAADAQRPNGGTSLATVPAEGASAAPTASQSTPAAQPVPAAGVDDAPPQPVLALRLPWLPLGHHLKWCPQKAQARGQPKVPNCPDKPSPQHLFQYAVASCCLPNPNVAENNFIDGAVGETTHNAIVQCKPSVNSDCERFIAPLKDLGTMASVKRCALRKPVDPDGNGYSYVYDKTWLSCCLDPGQELCKSH